jgi:complexin-1/2
MAGFLMKQMVGNKLNEVTSQIGGGSGDGEGAKAEEDPEIVAARKEQEDKRKEKHRRMEAEREKMRDGIRNKYSLHKKVCE